MVFKHARSHQWSPWQMFKTHSRPGRGSHCSIGVFSDVAMSQFSQWNMRSTEWSHQCGNLKLFFVVHKSIFLPLGLLEPVSRQNFWKIRIRSGQMFIIHEGWVGHMCRHHLECLASLKQQWNLASPGWLDTSCHGLAEKCSSKSVMCQTLDCQLTNGTFLLWDIILK